MAAIQSDMKILWENTSFAAGGAKGAVVRRRAIRATRTVREANGVKVICAASDDGGKTWRDLGVAAQDEDSATDLGDGCLLARKNGELWYSYRHNHLRGKYEKAPQFSLRVSMSKDGGKTWAAHSTVKTSEGAGRGLWSTFLLETSNGRILCFYDDEETPFAAGFKFHQWITARTWDAAKKAWVNPVTVSRASNPAHLSRDGMPSAIEIRPGMILLATEGVQNEKPHAGMARWVASRDGGGTWGWERPGRGVIYEVARPLFSVYSAWITPLPGGALLCAMAINEDRDTPDAPGTSAPQLHGAIKYSVSEDDGKTWSKPELVIGGGERDYMPQVLFLGGNRVVCLYLDFARNSYRAVPGTIMK